MTKAAFARRRATGKPAGVRLRLRQREAPEYIRDGARHGGRAGYVLRFACFRASIARLTPSVKSWF